MADPHAGKRVVVQLPTELMWRYREMDRLDAPRDRQKFTDLLVSVADCGIQVPLRLRYDGERAWVCNGNHRLAAARYLGIPSVPVALEPEPTGCYPDNGGAEMLPRHVQLIVDLCHEDYTASVRSYF